MAGEIQQPEQRKLRKNKMNHHHHHKNKPRNLPGGNKSKVKIDERMKKLFRKRAREYNSDDDDEEQETKIEEEILDGSEYKEEEDLGGMSEDEKEEEGGSDDDDEGGDVVQHGITRLGEGSRAFKMAFTTIINKNVPDDLLGPVLSGHKKLIAEKLAEEESERTVHGVAKKEKHLVGEKGHVKPDNFLDSHEKFLIGVSTKGVVKLFNAVNKAQSAQKGLDPSRSKDAKVLGKRKKAAFFNELRKKSSQAAGAPGKGEGDDGPAWAPLRDSYMLTNSRLKDWDKMPDNTGGDDIGETMGNDTSSDED